MILGGIIPDQDARTLMDAGIAAVFTPKDYDLTAVMTRVLDVIRASDWLIDLGPEGGDGGGEIVAVGTPEEIVKQSRSHTGRYLADLLQPRRRAAE